MKTANGEVCEITNTTFTGNSAYPTPQLKCPGAFCIPNDDVRVPGDGGAISASGGVLLLSGGCKFDSNSAQGRGGALCAALPFDNSYIQVLSQPGQRTGSEAIPGVLDNVFLHNSAQVSGGAIALRRYPLYISSAPADTSHQVATSAAGISLFQNNSAPTGGGISIFQSSSVVLSRLLMVSNHASAQEPSSQFVLDEGGLGHGGALSVVGGRRDTVTILATTFMQNSAAFGGGISLSSSPTCSASQRTIGCFDVTIDRSSRFQGNSAQAGAGGAVFWSHAGNLNITCNIQGRVQRAGVFTAAGLVDVNLPCADWDGNSVTAGYGPVIASTPFFLEPVEREVPFYTSNQPLLLNVTVQVGERPLNYSDAVHGREVRPGLGQYS